MVNLTVASFPALNSEEKQIVTERKSSNFILGIYHNVRRQWSQNTWVPPGGGQQYSPEAPPSFVNLVDVEQQRNLKLLVRYMFLKDIFLGRFNNWCLFVCSFFFHLLKRFSSCYLMLLKGGGALWLTTKICSYWESLTLPSTLDPNDITVVR